MRQYIYNPRFCTITLSNSNATYHVVDKRAIELMPDYLAMTHVCIRFDVSKHKEMNRPRLPCKKQ